MRRYFPFYFSWMANRSLSSICGRCAYHGDMRELSLILYNIRSAYNVGAILRTADGAGVRRVYLCGCTPTPVDRFGRKRPDIAKVALGAEDAVVWEYTEDVAPLMERLRGAGVRVVALEQDPRSVPYTALSLDMPTALILGEEVHGVPSGILAYCDTIIEIPMCGTKESLNVSVAAGIVMYQLANILSHPPTCR